MKTLHTELQRVTTVWLLCLVAGLSCAVFYTESEDNDYPRMGKRAFFTGGLKGSSYPRIGRSSPMGLGANPDVTSGLKNHFLFSKRGIFTSGDGTYPRIGRGGISSGELSAVADLMTSLGEAGDVVDFQEKDNRQLALSLLYFHLDKNGDKSLSREEFVEGMLSARDDGALCR